MENKDHTPTRPSGQRVIKLAIIAAVGRNCAIGRNNRLPWIIPEDLAHFKQLTIGHTIIMGRKTYESLPHGALPGRRNIVVSNTITHLPDCEVYSSLERAIDASRNESGNGQEPQDDDNTPISVFIIGGSSVYRQALPLATELHITLVEDYPTDADTFFPPIDANNWIAIKKEKHDGFSFITYIKRR